MPRPLEELVGRYGRTHGPFTEHEVGRTPRPSPRRACSAPSPRSRPTGASCAASSARRACGGSGATPRCCASCDVARWRRCAARSSRSSRQALARFLPAWHGIPAERRGTDAVVEALGLLAGAPIVASTLESDVLSARVVDYRPAQLDELCTSGDVLWVGAGAIGSADGRVRLCFADQLPLLAPGWEVQERPAGALHDALRTVLAERGASFWTQLRAAAPGTADDELLAALWDLVWAGEVTNDSSRRCGPSPDEVAAAPFAGPGEAGPGPAG